MKIGLLCEGEIDAALVPALVQRIARTEAGIRWPVRPDDVVENLGIRKGGYGQVQKAVQKLCILLDEGHYADYAFFLVVLDHNTRRTQTAIKKCIAARRSGNKFVIGIAIYEVEAWWLADRRNTLEWLGLAGAEHRGRYWDQDYCAEDDADPKRTLDELTRLSPTLQSRYGDGNTQLAREFADLWNSRAELGQIRTQCPKGFHPFCRKATAALKRHS
jgi:hypothetical protein